MLTPHQRKALNYKKHISLTANAGSGKTYVLSKRYLEIALNENIHLRNIAAITFTDKAAGELYKKISEEVNEKLNSESNPDTVKKLETIRRQLVSACISTIHSFCIDILKEYPVEAELDANFIPMDVNLSNELIELSVDEMIRGIIGQKSAPSDYPDGQNELKYLIRILGSKKRFEDELFNLIRNRINVLSLASGIYSQTNESAADFFYRIFRSVLKKIFTEKMPDLCNDLLKINKAAADNDGTGTGRINEIIAVLSKIPWEEENDEIINSALSLLNEAKGIIFTSGKTVRVNYLPRSLTPSLLSEIEFIRNFFADLSSVKIPENEKEIELELAGFGKSLSFFFNKTLEIYTRRKKENGYLDYEDILLHTSLILRNDHIREELSEKYKYIMIDEYQDTNEIQYQIFLPLLSFLKKNNLFVVGDEKQSIYMFRDAELEVFDRTRKDIELASGKEALLTLPDSFRMAPSLCVFINVLFRNLFSNPNIIYNEVKHSDLICARDDSVSGGVEILLNESGNGDMGNNEAELVAGRILKLADEKNISFSSIAVLCRKRSFFEELEKAFVKFEIPYSIVGGKGFYQRQSVYDIYNYFSFLLDRKNDTALVGILRSPFFSVSDSDIFEISLCRGYTFWEKLKKFAETREEIIEIVNTIEKNLQLANHLRITSLLRKILTESGYLAVLAAKPNGDQETANIEKLIKVTNTFTEQGFKTVYDYVEFLDLSISELEDEAQAPLPDELNLFPGSVKIMTLHQAKGLEFPAVFLFKCHEVPKKERVAPKSVSINKNLGLLTKVPLNENYFGEYFAAPVAGISDLVRNKKNFAEVKRLFYVGATRAKDYLFLSGTGLEFNPESFFGLLCKGLEIDLSKSSYSINSELSFLVRENGNYQNIKRNVSVNIPVHRNIGEIPRKKIAGEGEIENIPVLVESLPDFSKGEIFSATKISVYKQCPLKYKFSFELKYQDIFSLYKEWKTLELFSKNSDFEFKPEESENDQQELPVEKYSHSYPGLKGRIIHRILQKEVPLENLNNFIDEEIKGNSRTGEIEENYSGKFKEEIYSMTAEFLRSSTYSDIKSYAEYRNECQIYAAENDFFLYGIIDKLIFDNDRVIIIDYKTDDISVEEIKERSKSYLTQLRFYSYIISRLFPDIAEFEMRLIFIKHCNVQVVEKADRAFLKKIRDEINHFIGDIRMKRFPKNLKHCGECNFSIKGKCIQK